MEEYEEARIIARDDRNPAAMNSATTGKARISGLLERNSKDNGDFIVYIDEKMAKLC